MRIDWMIKAFGVVSMVVLSGCAHRPRLDGNDVEGQILEAFQLRRDFSADSMLHVVIHDVNCADSSLLGKRIVLAAQFHSRDTTEILLIPFASSKHALNSYAYSDVANRVILVNPTLIQEFTRTNTLNDSASYLLVLELMVLHEVGHFLLGREGAFDRPEPQAGTQAPTGQRDLQPEFMTALKKVELAADSLAIVLVRNNLTAASSSCLNISFDVERLLPGMQFQMAGMRILSHFGQTTPVLLHDPSDDHPNMELRINFMNYFLFPNSALRQTISDYLYDRTIAPVHAQESAPQIYQGSYQSLR